ncbi:MAG: hypothetical protein PF692_09840 [Kiritimatiellae bacterium]|jgi:hypothetical protein|nr:hypothetical protein [Kiritimatiellia bacterium]
MLRKMNENTRLEIPGDKNENRGAFRIAYIFPAIIITMIILTPLMCKSGCKEKDTNAAEKISTQETTNSVAKIKKMEFREEPETFKPKTYLPKVRESEASGSIDLNTFSPGRDLIYFDDKTVWWESENDDSTYDTEDDHTMHKNIKKPLEKLIYLVNNAGGTLKVQDTFRGYGIHSTKSLHKEGRAIDLTAENLELEQLAKFAWMAGFDWVYFETSGGLHIHASVKR